MLIQGVYVLTAFVMSGELNEWTPAGLTNELRPIAFLESSNGVNINHELHSRGPLWTAIGALGLKPIVAYEVYKTSPRLQSKYPGLSDEASFLVAIKSNYLLYNDAGTIHWNRIRVKVPSLNRAIYAWRFGLTASNLASDQEIDASPYVIAYHQVNIQFASN